MAGEHSRKAYTAFAINVTELLDWGRPNTIAVRVDNSFNEHMLPRGRSSDWAHDGGIYRPVQFLITPKAFLYQVDVDAIPDDSRQARLDIVARARNTSAQPWKGKVSLNVIDDDTGLNVLSQRDAVDLTIAPHAEATAKVAASLPEAKLWHFDHPHLYRLELSIANESSSHAYDSTFGVRRFEVKNTAFYLNGERVRLMGVERMAGSNPEFGMAEPPEWIEHDHADLKNLNCIFTRVHWQQDRRVLDYCDRHGILIQTEVPTWGPGTFKGMGEQPDTDILENGIEQLGEMIARDRNHPSIVSWGLCNEINGQNPPAYHFAEAMLQEAKRLDPNRLCSYASHSLRKTPGKDVSGRMDFIECNEYFGSWYPGDPAELSRNMDEIHAAFPGKPIVISEYGYCACTAERAEGDERRREILRAHDAVFREKDYIAGLIFFCYNDYRTHIGDRGTGAMRQRVHGVVDLYGDRKESYDLLRNESSPIESLAVEGHPTAFKLNVRSRATVPAYTLKGYRLRGVYYGYGEIPVERHEVPLPELTPGAQASVEVAFSDAQPWRVRFDILRPTGFSAYTLEWKA
ncbi:MAG: hypothetical protein JO022_16425, partial [Acidobacteriaceae bacterium]|nr:hypothetical protein [Acidobacteriaceae bacterium]